MNWPEAFFYSIISIGMLAFLAYCAYLDAKSEVALLADETIIALWNTSSDSIAFARAIERRILEGK